MKGIHIGLWHLST
jgi:hypothetical protein